MESWKVNAQGMASPYLIGGAHNNESGQEVNLYLWRVETGGMVGVAVGVFLKHGVLGCGRNGSDRFNWAKQRSHEGACLQFERQASGIALGRIRFAELFFEVTLALTLKLGQVFVLAKYGRNVGFIGEIRREDDSLVHYLERH
jgi:hypothetical protein